MTTLSLAALLAIDNNSVIHKLRVLPSDQLTSLLQLPSADLKQVVAMTTPEELSWLAGYLAPLPSQDAATALHELASGRVTIAALQAPPASAAASGDAMQASSAESNASSTGSTSSSSDSSSAESGSSGGLLPKEVVALWTPWANNGVAVAATLVVLLLIIAGVALALRREITHPPV
jgi:hypothetical protein